MWNKGRTLVCKIGQIFRNSAVLFEVVIQFGSGEWSQAVKICHIRVQFTGELNCLQSLCKGFARYPEKKRCKNLESDFNAAALKSNLSDLRKGDSLAKSVQIFLHSAFSTHQNGPAAPIFKRFQ